VKAAVYHGPRDVRIEDVPEPRRPEAKELVLDVGLAAICGTDSSEFLHGPRFAPLATRHPGSGHLGPIVLGHEFFGRIAAMGSGVEGFEVGQRVATGAGVWCGTCEWCRAGRLNLCERYYTLGLHTDGGLAERALVPASTCEPVPDACSDRAAALAQPLAIALHARDRAGVGAGQSVMVIGVGGIGSFIVAALRASEAGPIIAVDVDTRRLEVAERLGAHETVLIDATREGSHSSTNARGVDIAIEASGTEAGLAQATVAVRRGGRILLVGQHYQPRSMDLLDLTLREVEMTTTLAHICPQNLPEALHLLATTELAEHVIDRVIDLEDVVEDGLIALAERRVQGKILVEVGR
jgi:threonine dehydrogenase-like Zn-dependent dehydrogenase